MGLKREQDWLDPSKVIMVIIVIVVVVVVVLTATRIVKEIMHDHILCNMLKLLKRGSLKFLSRSNLQTSYKMDLNSDLHLRSIVLDEWMVDGWNQTREGVIIDHDVS